MSAERAEQGADEPLANPIARAWLMRHRDRATFRQIAAELNIGVATATRWVARAQAAIDFASGDEAAERARDLAAIDDWMAQLRAGVEAGEITLDVAAARVMPFFTRRAAMLGYDAPRKAAITIEPERPAARPNMELLAALKEEIERVGEAEREIEELEANDGLMN